jgi:riboflavin transporter FmnP
MQFLRERRNLEIIWVPFYFKYGGIIMDRAAKLNTGRLFTTSNLVKISMLGVMSFLIMFIEFPVMFFPEFLKLDISDLPAVIGGFALGPVAGVMIELVKNLLHFAIKSQTGGIGEFANFLVGGAFVFVSSGIYYASKSRRMAVIGCIAGTVAMGIVGGLANYFILLPFYSSFMPIETIVEMGSQFNSAITDLKTFVYYSIVPFNIIKGMVLSAATLMIYKRVSHILKG